LRLRGSGLGTMRRTVYGLIALGVFVLDQGTKLAVCRGLEEGQVVEAEPWFWLVHWRNTGGVWGTFQNLPEVWRVTLFLLVPAAGLAVLSWLFLRSRSPVDRVLLAGVLGAAAGNLADRARLGSVVDFLYFRWPGGPGWPAFNVADAVLSCGLVVLLFRSLTQRTEEGSHASDPL
jgi:signal peptidase II